MWRAPCSFNARVCFRPCEVTTDVSTSVCCKPYTQVSGNEDEILTPLHVAVPPSVTDMTSITYHPNPLIVSASFFILLFLTSNN